MRDRRGRGVRGPVALPGPLSAAGVPLQLSRREQFDTLVLDLVEELTPRWESELRDVEFGVEEVPLLPHDWQPASVPLSALVRGTTTTPTRIVIFRLPVQERANSRTALERVAREALVARVAELLGRDPDDITPR